MTQTKVSPLISYYGGKQRIASKIIPYLQDIPHAVRAIPFAGGLGVESNWPRPEVNNKSNYRVAINDIEELLINLYRVARDRPEEINQLIQGTPYSQSEYKKAKEICKNPDAHDDLIKAWAYYVNIQCSFAHKLSSGWGCGVFSQSNPATWVSKQKQLPLILERFNDVYIGCEDALRFIERWDSPQTLFYCDPPYPGTDQGHYKGYSLEDWVNLCNCLDGIKGSYVLSNYPQETEPQSAQRRIEIEATMSARGTTKNSRHAIKKKNRGNTKRTEILWICDRSDGLHPELLNYTQLNLFP